MLRFDVLDVLTLLELLFVFEIKLELMKFGDEFTPELDWFNSSELAENRDKNKVKAIKLKELK